MAGKTCDPCPQELIPIHSLRPDTGEVMSGRERLRVGHWALEEPGDHLLASCSRSAVFGVGVVVVPGFGVPDLGAVARADDGEVAAEAGVFAQDRRGW